MSAKIAADHLARGAIVYVRQSTMTQVLGNLESQKRQYALADAARAAGFVSVTVIDGDLGRSGSGLAARRAPSPGEAGGRPRRDVGAPAVRVILRMSSIPGGRRCLDIAHHRQPNCA